jgi:glycosyltransferase involved in cell wall biosynthesis
MEKKRKIRVAIFADVLKENLDGVTHTLYNIIERVPKDKFDLLFITPLPPTDLAAFPYPVVVCRYIKMPLYGEYPLAFPYCDKNLENALKKFKPDLVHFTSPTFLGRYARNYAKVNNLPLVSMYHTHFPMYVDYYFKYLPFLRFLKYAVPYILRFYYNRCDMLYVPTKPVLEDLAVLGIERDRMMIWARGIEVDKYTPRKRDVKYIDGLCGRGTIRVLFVSRLFWLKEIVTIVKIYKKLSTTHPNIRMVITGDGPQRKYMEKRMPNAVFTGKLLNHDLQRMYASCDIFLFPSITETFGNVVLEAMASGLPVVAAAKGGPMGIVTEGETGYLVEPKNIDDFSKKISMLVDNPALLKKMSKNAEDYARSQKWEILCRDLFKSYEKAISDNKKRLEELNEVAL